MSLINKFLLFILGNARIEELFHYVNEHEETVRDFEVYLIKGNSVYENEEGFFRELHDIIELNGLTNLYATNNDLLSYGFVKTGHILMIFSPKTYIDKIQHIAEERNIQLHIIKLRKRRYTNGESRRFD